MPFYNVYLSNTVSREFVVQAESREDAEMMVLEAAAGVDEPDYRKMISLRHDTQNAVNITNADKSDWDQALKKRKVK